MSKPIFADTTFYKPAVTEGDYRSENSHFDSKVTTKK